MGIKAFFDQFVDGYLLEDLETMSKSKLDEGKTSGAVGYPMIATTLAGMELLGGLLIARDESFNDRNGQQYFLNFWNKYFSIQFPGYKDLGELFYSLARHGIAHTFVAKHGIEVDKGPEHETIVDVENKRVSINANIFAREFKQTYIKRVKPLLDTEDQSLPVDKNSMQKHLDDMDQAYLQKSDTHFNNLKPDLVKALKKQYEAQSKTSRLFDASASVVFEASSSTASMSSSSTNTTTMLERPTSFGIRNDKPNDGRDSNGQSSEY